jgi:hypothetical protein
MPVCTHTSNVSLIWLGVKTLPDVDAGNHVATHANRYGTGIVPTRGQLLGLVLHKYWSPGFRVLSGRVIQ